MSEPRMAELMDDIDEWMQKRTGKVPAARGHRRWTPRTAAPPAGGQLGTDEAAISPHQAVISTWAIAGGAATPVRCFPSSPSAIRKSG